ncbi:peptidoglycan-recognition protein LE [Episyrphus balteatus]|uniref:peptidoglycan-recognition protein LE n=1 Tax=Episyrphus balteatus TaxID=286459 RepID=UPI0024863F32|nr:peptidoglycan-recognition protein LE [Episyrphus balteatus]
MLKEKNPDKPITMSKILTKESNPSDVNKCAPANLKTTTNSNKDKSELVTQWINTSSFNDDDDDGESSIFSDSTAVSSSVVDSDYDIGSLSLQDHSSDSRKMSVTSSSNNTSSFPSQSDVLQHIFNKDSSIQTVGNVHIENSSQVHIGNVTYITGPIHIINPNQEHISKIFNSTKNVPSPSTHHNKPNVSVDPEEDEESSKDDAFLRDNIRPRMAEHVLHIVERRRWLAQKPMEPYQKLAAPAEFVIISHSATEMATSMPDNIFLIRNIQCFHIESCRWNDIAYNFMIGNDGNIYEGRGWGHVGAHAKGYNHISVGISFIGCFMRDLPPARSLAACKKIIKRGVEQGYIAPDYKLIGHCQCTPTESPGRKLYEEIQTWDHFTADIDI